MRYTIYNGNGDGTFNRDSTRIQAENFASVPAVLRERHWMMVDGQLFLVIEAPDDPPHRTLRAFVFRFIGPTFEILT